MEFRQSVYDNAKQITDGCMGYEEAFCTAACPMHTDVKKYIRQIGEGNVEGAMETIREKLFLPNTLGRICAHPCEAACRRESEFGQPLSVAALKRYAAEKADEKTSWDTTTGEDTGKSVAVIGAGPAGAQAAIDLRKAGHRAVIYDKLNVVGGMMRVGIPEYRLPREVIDFEYSYLEDLGVEFKMGVEIGKDITFTDLRAQHDAVIVANGAHKGGVPPVKGKEAQGVTNACDFLKEVSLTRQSETAGKRIAVVGGGDVAMDCARSAWRIGAEEVSLLTLESFDELPASKEEIHESMEEDVRFLNSWGTDEIIADETGRVQTIRLKKVLSVFDENGKFAPQFGEETMEIEADTVIFATGQQVEDVTGGLIEQKGGGRYVTNPETLATSEDDVFVAGDASGGYIVVEAMALGKKAAKSADRFLNQQELEEGRNFKYEYSFVTNLDVPLPKGTENLPRQSGNHRAAEERKHDFRPYDLGYTDEQAKQEASRCLQCECKLCMEECLMMNDYGECPQDIFGQFLQDGEIEPIVPYSCNVCGGCTHVCPNDYPIGETFMAMRKDFILHNDGKSPMEGHKAIEMHQKLGFSKVFTTKVKGGK
ncbi:FAD-dependent oxidoreductase [Salisediminibacterium halotolerans]|uniref:FAD-dependent oxidoreductase n=1 Tax=Salisediminibacterium halotolerans TaxID=517425 RepID=UPI000EB1CCBD|nr:FAD-dependent oxidoreductase [Salisediminibacterium halotolerans]RLJ69253.1 NADPH-dependent glutamate synthase beta subunit-like oxidoreductase [Actinophytocola xinjiangensis]RPE87012.1 NADPH-dependent glutamate synthase beta subunit-like oxidoreductase [Salisediminibacterium halotolerans]TWG32255.1 NADPH-dependent glutamate synthase beta subunit-like oxidoreductase [Salisediminibacterium halotolerans]GEL08006.1 oxidoreductase [Salisediminibacterium halotolerans]